MAHNWKVTSEKMLRSYLKTKLGGKNPQDSLYIWEIIHLRRVHLSDYSRENAEVQNFTYNVRKKCKFFTKEVVETFFWVESQDAWMLSVQEYTFHHGLSLQDTIRLYIHNELLIYHLLACLLLLYTKVTFSLFPERCSKSAPWDDLVW